ncbi:hypothetical protein [Novosphingobium soli]|uniref:Uncharacterized protein n=1 Tax=Novosphingobium soli TaxID=574956 RepID=A0ABV6CWV7_9SPHN
MTMPVTPSEHLTAMGSLFKSRYKLAPADLPQDMMDLLRAMDADTGSDSAGRNFLQRVFPRKSPRPAARRA